MFSNRHNNLSSATVFLAVAFVVISCSNKLKATGETAGADVPVQVVENMQIIQTDKGKFKMRVEAPVMERYQNDSINWDLFPDGFFAYAYDEDGLLETEIKGDEAKHVAPNKDNKKTGEELWAAYGNVKVTNLIKNQILETDTLYWDPGKEKIYTDCYVRIIDPQGLMQGYGMESDQRARTTVLRRVFNNYAIMDNDSTAVKIDSVNFIGPFPKK